MDYKYMDYPWVMHELSMDNLWIMHGLCMDCPWTVHGFVTENPWMNYPQIILGISRVIQDPWIIHGDHPWVILEKSWLIHGLPIMEHPLILSG